jgi:hypothetical protein
MNMPGFTAEAALEKANGQYRTAINLHAGRQLVYQAQFDFARGYAKPVPASWPIYVLGRPLLEPSCICLALDSQGRCLRWICF